MKERFYDLVEQCPIIAAIKDDDGLQRCCEIEELKVVFVLYGDVCSIKKIVDTLHKANKIAMIHIDLITGLSSREVAVDFIHEYIRADGIISTKVAMVQRAMEYSMYTVLRFFVIDSMSLNSINQLEKQYRKRPDMIEVLPGVMPKIIEKICKNGKIPVIAGGLISDKEDVMKALGAGAIAVSTTAQEIWEM